MIPFIPTQKQILMKVILMIDLNQSIYSTIITII